MNASVIRRNSALSSRLARFAVDPGNGFDYTRCLDFPNPSEEGGCDSTAPGVWVVLRPCGETRRIKTMSRRCELTGKGALVGHKVSHSNRKTKRRFLPNLVNVTLMSDALNRSVRLRISANGLRTVEHRGGLDAFLLKAGEAELSPTALGLKREITRKLNG